MCGCALKVRFATFPACAIMRAKPAVVKDEPRSDVNTRTATSAPVRVGDAAGRVIRRQGHLRPVRQQVLLAAMRVICPGAAFTTLLRRSHRVGSLSRGHYCGRQRQRARVHPAIPKYTRSLARPSRRRAAVRSTPAAPIWLFGSRIGTQLGSTASVVPRREGIDPNK